jgi:hypothetical protein
MLQNIYQILLEVLVNDERLPSNWSKAHSTDIHSTGVTGFKSKIRSPRTGRNYVKMPLVKKENQIGYK